MRRAQTDSGSQPVRNLITNPSMESSGTPITVRTNLVTNPRGVSAYGEYQASGHTITPNVAITGHPDGITTANRVSYPNGAANPGVTLLNPLTSGTQYTASAWVYHETIPTGGTQALAQAGVAAGAGPAIVATTWQRLSWTFTASGTSQLGFRVSGQSGAGAYLITGILVETRSDLGAFFDGATAASGDFTYAWSGPVNASTSVQNGVRVGFYTAGASFAIRSTDWGASPGYSMRIIPGTSGVTNTWAYIAIATEIGRKYTFSAKARLIAPLAGTLESRARRIMARSGSDFQSAAFTNAIGVYMPQVVFTAGATSTQLFLWNGASPGNGDVWYDDVMLVEGDYSGDYIDGTKPLSKWDGAVNSSTSVGYPPQLFDFAGKPILDYSTPGTYLLDDSFGSTEARTFYTVMENLGENTGAVSPVLKYGDLALNDTVPNTSIQLRQDNDNTANGSNNLFLRRTGAMGVNASIKTGRHVAAWGVNTSGQLFMGVDGNTRLTDTQVMTMPHQKFVIDLDQPLNKHVRTIMYRGLHDSTTALAISRYLGNKYGAAVA